MTVTMKIHSKSIMDPFVKLYQTSARQNNGFKLIRPETEIGRNSLRYRGAVTCSGVAVEYWGGGQFRYTSRVIGIAIKTSVQSIDCKSAKKRFSS